jgi:predicted class III extradiol MEMO1 family dioxygenase
MLDVDKALGSSIDMYPSICIERRADMSSWPHAPDSTALHQEPFAKRVAIATLPHAGIVYSMH